MWCHLTLPLTARACGLCGSEDDLGFDSCLPILRCVHGGQEPSGSQRTAFSAEQVENVAQANDGEAVPGSALQPAGGCPPGDRHDGQVEQLSGVALRNEVVQADDAAVLEADSVRDCDNRECWGVGAARIELALDSCCWHRREVLRETGKSGMRVEPERNGRVLAPGHGVNLRITRLLGQGRALS